MPAGRPRQSGPGDAASGNARWCRSSSRCGTRRRTSRATLESIFAQDYPADRLEVRVYDGDSTDRSRAIAEALCAGRPLATVSRNPRITQAAGWNLGIDEAQGDIIGIVSAHCELAPDYVSTAVETLERTGADMVGGLMRAVGEGDLGEAVAIATSTPFGVGNARFHFTDVEEEVDTVYMGLCRRETYRRLRFDEEMVRDQDDELSYRLLDEGGRIVCNPAIRSSYRNRSTFRSLWKQYYQYGFWKVRVMQKHPDQVRTAPAGPAGLRRRDDRCCRSDAIHLDRPRRAHRFPRKLCGRQSGRLGPDSARAPVVVAAPPDRLRNDPRRIWARVPGRPGPIPTLLGIGWSVATVRPTVDPHSAVVPGRDRRPSRSR